MTRTEMATSLLDELVSEYGMDASNQKVKDYVELLVDDLTRKGCTPDNFDINCQKCPYCTNGTCPLNNWEKVHPEFAIDELGMKLKKFRAELFGAKLYGKDGKVKKTMHLPEMTVEELIEKLKALPKDAKTSRIEIEID